MRQTSRIIMLIVIMVVSVALVSCNQNSIKDTQLNSEKLNSIIGEYKTYSFQGELSVKANTPSFTLTSMNTIPFDHDVDISWKGKYQYSPFQVEAEIIVKTIVQGAEIEIPVDLLMIENDVYLSSPIITQDRYIHQNVSDVLTENGSIPALLQTVRSSLLSQLEHSALKTASESTVTYSLDKTSMDDTIQQLLFYDVPNYISSLNSKDQNTLLQLSTQRDHYLQNSEAFYTMTTVKKAEMIWKINEADRSLHTSGTFEFMLQDATEQGTLTLEFTHSYINPNEEIVFVSKQPRLEDTLPFKDILSLITMFGK